MRELLTQIEDGNENENPTSCDRLPDLIDESVIPEDLGPVNRALGLLNEGRLGEIPESVTTSESGSESTLGENGLDDLHRFESD